MIDTIILKIPRHHFFVTDERRFLNLVNNPGFSKAVNNATKAEIATGKYYPRLAKIRQGASFSLKIEFSGPKLMFGNNVEELRDSDFEELLLLLSQRCQEMGVRIQSRNLKNAQVLALHLSKNIFLAEGYTVSYAITHLSKVDYAKWFDVADFKYTGSGHSVQVYSQSRAWVMYDKMADVNKPKNRKIDSFGDFPEQLSLFEIQKPKEVFRIEYRLNNRRVLARVLGFDIKTDAITFQDVFSTSLSRKVLLLNWNNYYGPTSILFTDSNKHSREWLQKLLVRYPNMKSARALKQIGMMSLCADEGGVREFRRAMEARYPKWSWSKENKVLKEMAEATRSVSITKLLGQVQRQLIDFVPFRFDSS